MRNPMMRSVAQGLPPARCADGRSRGGRKGQGSALPKWCTGQGLFVQEALQRLASVVLGLPGHAGIRRTIEALIRSRIHVQLDWYSGDAERPRWFSVMEGFSALLVILFLPVCGFLNTH